MEPKIVDQRAEAREYMEKQKISKLFDILGSKLARMKPEDPNEFLLKELKDISHLKATDQPVSLFTEADIETMFSIFDLTNRGYVTQTQYMKALSAVGIETPRLPAPAEQQINKAKFISHIYAEVVNDAF